MDSEIVLVLLDHGAEASAQNADGRTPLHRASLASPPYKGDRVIQQLLERGVDVNARDKHQESPLHLASYERWPENVRVLLDHGADPDARNADGQTPLHRVSQHPNYTESEYFAPPTARLLLERGVDVDARDKEQATPLHMACYYGCVGVAEALLDHEARFYAEDRHGHTPLHQVVLGNHNYQRHLHRVPTQGSIPKSDLGKAVRLTQRLLERGAEVNAQNKDQETPLHLASRLRLHEIARILLKHGADVDV
ncbi:ankyrin repeat-containing domain protein [Lactarius hatsudake]|nr:ankyrin repeat-containing domain protein [Lactarius hatsudake]